MGNIPSMKVEVKDMINNGGKFDNCLHYCKYPETDVYTQETMNEYDKKHERHCIKRCKKELESTQRRIFLKYCNM